MGENRIIQDLYEENQKLKARIAELEAQHFSECRQIAHYSDELAKAKELLKAAVECIDYKVNCHLGNCDECIRDPDHCDYDSCFLWKYRIEALALIGEDGDT